MFRNLLGKCHPFFSVRAPPNVNRVRLRLSARCPSRACAIRRRGPSLAIAGSSSWARFCCSASSARQPRCSMVAYSARFQIGQFFLGGCGFNSLPMRAGVDYRLKKPALRAAFVPPATIPIANNPQKLSAPPLAIQVRARWFENAIEHILSCVTSTNAPRYQTGFLPEYRALEYRDRLVGRQNKSTSAG